MNTETIHGITYKKPAVTLLHASPLVNGEIAARTAYNSFSNSEHEIIRNFTEGPLTTDIDSSKLLEQLCHVYFHSSVIEHINLTFNITTTRGVLQELVRHRIASYTVQSTRYTMQKLLHAFNVAIKFDDLTFASNTIEELNIFGIEGRALVVEIESLLEKLLLQYDSIGSSEFINLSMSSNAKEIFESNSFITPNDLYKALCETKDKRNVFDPFKWVVTDTFNVSLIMTINLRSLNNFLTLRLPGSAYFLIQQLANSMINTIPKPYINLLPKVAQTKLAI